MQSTAIPAVLCVDDEELVLDLLQKVLAFNGFHSLAATNGREALRLLEQNPVDGVILDYSMPDMNGGLVAAEVRALNPHIPIILFSGSLDIPPSTLLMMDACVAKGEGLSKLLTILRWLLRVPSATPLKGRRFPRYPVELPFSIIVSRSGEKAMIEGSSTQLAEGGIGGRVDAEIEEGEVVRIRICDSLLDQPLEPSAQVRYRKGHMYGFQFLEVSPGDRAVLRQLCGLPASA